MDWTCPICGKTFMRAKQAHKCYSGGTPELAFPGKQAKWLPLYLALLDAVQARVPFACDYVPSGTAVWRWRSIFAHISGRNAGLYVNFHSNNRLQIDGLKAAMAMSANRVMHVVCFSDPDRIPEIADYIVASYVLTEQAGRAVTGGGEAE